ncbi:MAG: LON peptidase substrate-binding domain-containing protein [Gemmataceae bacterium]|nr:LON peptidase substrate-binding domain-containing protein [Gemmataceae bacterium]
MSSDQHLPDDFDGTARLFPLPNLVLFPFVGQPLHIFEPRYRQLMQDALDTDRLMALALYRPGWEEDDSPRPALHPMVCLGRIAAEQQLPDGRWNLMLHGLTRARIVEEVVTDRLYRSAEVEIVEEVPAGDASLELRTELAMRVLPFFEAQPTARRQFGQLVASPLPLGTLCDVFGYALPLDVQDRQRLLDEPDVAVRVALLLTLLEGATPLPAPPRPMTRRYPPTFSDN